MQVAVRGSDDAHICRAGSAFSDVAHGRYRTITKVSQEISKSQEIGQDSAP